MPSPSPKAYVHGRDLVSNGTSRVRQRASKKPRPQRQEAKQKKRGKVNPAVAFIAVVVVALVALAAVAYFVDARPEPPRPRAVWSPEHGHWD